MGMQRVAVRRLDRDQDAPHAFSSKISGGGLQELRIEATPSLVNFHHRVKQPDLSGAKGEANTEIFLVVVRAVKPHVGKEHRPLGEDTGPCPLRNAALEGVERVTECRELLDVLRRGPANPLVRHDRSGEGVRENLQDRHARHTKDRRGDEHTRSEH